MVLICVRVFVLERLSVAVEIMCNLFQREMEILVLLEKQLFACMVCAASN